MKGKKTKHMARNVSKPQQYPYLSFSADFLLRMLWQLLGQCLNFASIKEFKWNPGRHHIFQVGYKSQFVMVISCEAEHVQGDKSPGEGEGEGISE